MIPTPDLSHLTWEDYEHVYEPAEDTFILLDALEKDAEELRVLGPHICLEIGSGSGCVSTFLSIVLSEPGAPGSLILCTDINPRAASCTARTGAQNKVSLDPLLASFASPFSARLKHAVDILLFNPPYVPTSDEEADSAQQQQEQHHPGLEEGQGPIAGAWAGGEDGMGVTNVFLDQVEHLLSPSGRFYLVAVARNNVPCIRAQMHEHYALESEIVLQRRAGREFLSVIRFTRKHESNETVSDVTS